MKLYLSCLVLGEWIDPGQTDGRVQVVALPWAISRERHICSAVRRLTDSGLEEMELSAFGPQCVSGIPWGIFWLASMGIATPTLLSGAAGWKQCFMWKASSKASMQETPEQAVLSARGSSWEDVTSAWGKNSVRTREVSVGTPVGKWIWEAFLNEFLP